jgi:hypothetical protein
LYLPLKCKECDRTREHFTKYVLVDVDSLENGGPESKYDAHILDHEVICPKCGAVDRYEMTSIAHLRMSGSDDIVEMFKSEADKKTKRLKPNPRVLYFRSIVFGENMHPLDGLDEYRRQIAISPDDALLHSKMGSLLRMLMRYPEALEAQRYAYRLAPDNSEVIIRLAVSEHDFGDEETAAKLYQKIVDLSSAKKKFSSIDENTILAIKGIKNLKLNKPSPNEVIVATRDGEPVVHPSTHVRRFQAKPPAITSRGSKTKRGRRGRRRK